ncbi:MAG: hypothetical protein ACQETK_02700 [Pseudomonadota bacterium]
MNATNDEDPRAAGLFPGCEESADARPPEPIVYQARATLSLRQIDQWNGVPKGTAFRLFKARKDQMVEGRDFFHIPEGAHPALTEGLRVDGRIYPTTVHVLLLTAGACAQMHEEWRARTHNPGCGCPDGAH